MPRTVDPLAPADQAFALAALAWGSAPGLNARLAPHLAAPFERARAAVGPLDPVAALRHLLAGHAAQVRADPSRVHPSWYARALRDEPPSVRHTALAGLPAAVAPELPDIPQPDRPGHPGALALARSLAFAPLVGDLPDRPDDPPAVLALSRFDAAQTALLLRANGFAHAIADGRDPGDDPLTGPVRDELAAAMIPDLPADAAGAGPVATESSPDVAGLAALSRLLGTAEPYRVRWALQHLPYPAAKTLRGLMVGAVSHDGPRAGRDRALLRAAWNVLHDSGRLPTPWPGEDPS